MVKHLKKRLLIYIEKYQKKGYPLERIKKALVIYGFEPKYVERVIMNYRIRRHIHLFFLLLIVVLLPIFSKPVMTGYAMLSNSSVIYEDKTSQFAVIFFVLLMIMIIILPILLVGLIFQSDKGFWRTFVSKYRLNFFFRRNSTNEEENQFKRNPLMKLYLSLTIFGVLAIFISMIFRLWMLIFFSLLIIILSIIGYFKIRKMYYKEI
jgi:hypothetical protein